MTYGRIIFKRNYYIIVSLIFMLLPRNQGCNVKIFEGFWVWISLINVYKSPNIHKIYFSYLILSILQVQSHGHVCTHLSEIIQCKNSIISATGEFIRRVIHFTVWTVHMIYIEHAFCLCQLQCKSSCIFLCWGFGNYWQSFSLVIEYYALTISWHLLVIC